MTRWVLMLGPLAAAVAILAWRAMFRPDRPETVSEGWIRDQMYSRRGDRA